MMKTPSPLNIHRKTPNFQNSPFSNYSKSIITKHQKKKEKKRRFNYIKVARKRFGRFVSRMFFWRKKVNSEIDEFNSVTTLDDDQLGDLSYSVTDSAGTSQQSSARFKTSSSYGSSSAASLQLSGFALSFTEILRATANFSPANIIGEGGFGTVYKGKLKNGSIVAIKRARKDNNGQRLSAEFKNEILTLSKIDHNKLVKYFGYLEHGDEKIIVVEYISHGTLREHLDGKHGDELELAQRLDIVIDVAHALTYLHRYSDPPIIHRDIKSSNILITEKLQAKVADFGFARMASEDPGATHISTQVKGTAGYLDPEYLKTYQLTEKSDVYSFGVLLVEIITGRYPVEPERSSNEKVTVKWVLHRLKRGEVVILMDPRLRRSPASIEAVEKVLKVARRCLAPERQMRPSMRKCVEVLWEIRKDLRQNSHNATTSRNSAIITREVRSSGQDLYALGDSDNYRFCSA